jgi:hypothetical protein
MATDVIRLRYATTCKVCGTTLPVSTKAHWDKAAKTVTCLECGGPTLESVAARDSSAESPPLPFAPVRPESGRAGSSAQREYERRHEKREELLDRRFGRFAGVVKFLVDDPQSTRAWAKGSEGERILADSLTRRIGDRAVLLHDRKIPRSTANIDHLVIAQTGVWIIDAKKYSGRLQRRDKGGWRKIDYHVYVNGRDQTKLAVGLHKRAAVVRIALGDLEVPIHTALCFIDAEWDFFLKPFQVQGVWVAYGKKLAEMIAVPGPLTNVDVLRVANVLANALPAKEI